MGRNIHPLILKAITETHDEVYDMGANGESSHVENAVFVATVYHARLVDCCAVAPSSL